MPNHRRRVHALESDLGDLLERHDRGLGGPSLTRYGDAPVAFIREVLGGEPWEEQDRIAEAVLESPLGPCAPATRLASTGSRAVSPCGGSTRGVDSWC